ncbi:hypothetical protein QR680_010893 [Steinernema hermaphroditum]|uniref:Uncharacterized protein n=1 Tax=Steinernema hermaphroditum TaxID=289476 RepID=A0AA39IRX7_9BILA|nr:hypothetical protein QR680_010893 [Steinernema hermaphroditum]
MGKRSDEEEEDDEEEDLEPKIVSVPAFPSKYFIAKEVDRVLRGKGTKKCVLLMYEKTYDCLNSVESSSGIRSDHSNLTDRLNQCPSLMVTRIIFT